MYNTEYRILDTDLDSVIFVLVFYWFLLIFSFYWYISWTDIYWNLQTYWYISDFWFYWYITDIEDYNLAWLASTDGSLI